MTLYDQTLRKCRDSVSRAQGISVNQGVSPEEVIQEVRIINRKYKDIDSEYSDPGDLLQLFYVVAACGGRVILK